MQKSSPVPDSESTDVKEVFAFFGLAAYHGQVLEKGLVNMLAVLNSRGLRITVEQWDSLFDSFDGRTLGQLLREGRQLIAFDSTVDSLLSDALKKRNWIAHQFFADFSIEFGFDDGRQKMIDALREATELFMRADLAATAMYERDAAALGLTQERIEYLVSQMRKEYEEKQKG